MIKEPVLSSKQYYVLVADGATGHVLTANGDVCLTREGEVNIVFNDLVAARLYISKGQLENETWEFGIYDSSNECVELWPARKWKR